MTLCAMGRDMLGRSRSLLTETNSQARVGMPMSRNVDSGRRPSASIGVRRRLSASIRPYIPPSVRPSTCPSVRPSVRFSNFWSC